MTQFLQETSPNPDKSAIEEAVRGYMSQMWTAIPCVVSEDTKDGHTCQLQPAIRGTVQDSDGKRKQVDYPLLETVPVHHLQGGKNVHTMPSKKDDEVLAIFSSRPHDSWHQSGGTKNNPIDSRTHHLSDALMLRGFRSDKRKIKNVSEVSAQNRSEDGKHTHDLHPTDGITAKSVDKDDKEENPWKDAKKYFMSFVKSATGVSHQGVNNDTKNESTLDHDQIIHAVNNGKHSVKVHKDDAITASADNDQHSVKINKDGIAHKSTSKITHDAPNVEMKALVSVLGNITATQNISALGGLFGTSISAGGASMAGGGMSMPGSASIGGNLIRSVVG